MGKPSAPDPAATGAAQGAANKETAIATSEMNHVNQYGPFGSLTYQQIGSNADGTPVYAQNTNLSAPVQGIVDQTLQNQGVLAGTAGNLLNTVHNQYASPIDLSGVGALNYGASPDSVDALNSRYQTSAGPAAQASTSYAGTGNFATTAGNGGGDIQRSLGGMADIPGVIGGAQNAAYANQMAYLDPQFKNQQSDLNSQLAAQGITQGSDAWNRAQSELSRNQTFGQQQAQNAAFGQGLQAGNTALGMSIGAGNFANQAQQQGYSQAANNAALNNQAANAQTQTSIANMQSANQLAEFNAMQQNAQNQFNVGANNNAMTQALQNFDSAAGVNNAANAQGMQNAFAQYNQPLQTYNALSSGAQPSMPNFNATPQSQVAPTDIAGIVNNGYANQVGASNGQMAGVGTLAMAAAYMF